MHVSEILDYHKLIEHRDNRLVSIRSHPTLPLTIWNYTDAAQYGWKFDDTLEECRGLVLDEHGRVVARPFKKFYSADQPRHAEIDLDEWIIVTDKADGSLICYTYDEEYGPIVTSRGSFESDQAIAAGEMLQGVVPYNPRVTYLFELVGPSNRIVLEYPKNELIILGSRVISTGYVTHPDTALYMLGQYDIKVVETFPYRTLRELLQAPDRDGAEGYVIRTEDGRMLKHKFAAYVDLHRIIFGMNERTIWEKFSQGQKLPEILEGLPDEIHGFVEETYTMLLHQYWNIVTDAKDDFDDAPAGVDRKTFAMYATKTRYPSLLFAMLDGKDIKPQVYKMIYPKVEK